MGIWFFVGGIGYGCVRVSMVWRSVKLNMVKEIGIGWEYGILEVKVFIKFVGGLNQEFMKKWNKIKIKIKIGKEKMYFFLEIDVWRFKRQSKENVFVGVLN